MSMIVSSRADTWNTRYINNFYKNIIFVQQVIEQPMAYNFKIVNHTRIWFRFGSPKVTVKKEVWAYTNLSFVADCGGLLGLFIGFNFLMIWDLIVIVYHKIKTSF